MSFADALHAEPCRRCGSVDRRSEMIAAAKVNGNPRARGWFCHWCAANSRRLLKPRYH